jgi:nucleotide-binding universal stress UspA family protein
MEKREAERLLSEQVDSMPELLGIKASIMVVAGDPFDGILRAAAEIQADLIVMGSHRKQLLLDIFIGTTIERVIRKGSFPVLMVNHDAQRRYERVVAPVDMSDASANALRAALSTRLISDKGATLLHALDAVAVRGQMFVAGSDQASIDSHVAGERRRAMDELAAFVVANDLKHMRWAAPRRGRRANRDHFPRGNEDAARLACNGHACPLGVPESADRERHGRGLALAQCGYSCGTANQAMKSATLILCSCSVPFVFGCVA